MWAFLTPSERLALAAVARENDMTIAAVIRDAVNDFVADYSDRKVFQHR